MWGRTLTVDAELGFDGVRGAEVVGDDALVFALTSELHVAQLQCGGVLRDLADLSHLRAQVSLVMDLGVGQDLVVLLPGEGHRGVAGAGRGADERHVGVFNG